MGTTLESYFQGSSARTEVRNSLKSRTVSIGFVEVSSQRTFRRMRNRANDAMHSLLALHTVGHLGIRHAAMAWSDTVKEVECRRHTNRATYYNS